MADRLRHVPFDIETTGLDATDAVTQIGRQRGSSNRGRSGQTAPSSAATNYYQLIGKPGSADSSTPSLNGVQYTNYSFRRALVGLKRVQRGDKADSRRVRAVDSDVRRVFD